MNPTPHHPTPTPPHHHHHWSGHLRSVINLCSCLTELNYCVHLERDVKYLCRRGINYYRHFYRNESRSESTVLLQHSSVGSWRGLDSYARWVKVRPVWMEVYDKGEFLLYRHAGRQLEREALWCGPTEEARPPPIPGTVLSSLTSAPPPPRVGAFSNAMKGKWWGGGDFRGGGGTFSVVHLLKSRSVPLLCWIFFFFFQIIQIGLIQIFKVKYDWIKANGA